MTSNEYEVPVGHWRVAESTNATFRCPYGERSCIGGDESGDFLCSDNFSGLLCSTAVRTYHVDWVFQDSRKCTENVAVSAIFLPLMCISFIALFSCCKIGKLPPPLQTRVARASTSPAGSTVLATIGKFFSTAINLDTVNETAHQIDLQATEAEQARSMNFLHRVKILVCVLQVVSSLPSTLHQPFGLYSSLLLRALSHASLPSLQALPWACFSSSMFFSHAPGLRPPDLVEQMAAATVLPLAGLFLTGVFYLLHMEILHLATARIRRRAVLRAWTASYGTAALVMLHYASGGIWQLTAGVLSASCVDLDPDGIFPNSSLTVMLSDVTVSCESSSYRSGYLWALVAALLYMAVFPALQGLLVYFYGAHVDKHHSSAPAMLVPPDCRGANTSHSSKYNRHTGATVKSESSCSSDDCSSGSQRADADSDRDEGVRDEERGHCQARSVPQDLRVAQSGVGRKGKDEKMKDKEKSRLGSTVALHRAVSKSIMRRRRASLYFGGIALIYQAYTSHCRYWELNALAARWFYLALLPALFPYHHPAQVFLAIGATMLFLQRLLAVQPYADPDNQRLAVCGAVQVLSLLICAAAQEIGLQGMHAVTGLPLLDMVTCLVLLSMPVYFLYLVFWRPQYRHFTAEDDSAETSSSSHRPLAHAAATHGHPSAAHTLNGANRTHRHSSRRSRSCRGRTQPRTATTVHPPSPDESPGGSDLGSPSLRTPDRAPTASSASLSRSPAGSLLFQHHRDLALCTQETVTYDVLSAEKKARVRFPQFRTDRDRGEGSGAEDGGEWESEYSPSVRDSEYDSDSSAEHKNNLSTESGEEGWGALYRPQSRSYARGAASSRTLLQPPSPESTPPQSLSGDESAWDLGDCPVQAMVPPLSRPSAPAAQTPPARRLPAPLNLHPLSVSRRPGPPAARAGLPPPLRSALSLRSMRQSFQHESFPAADMATEEYGAELDASVRDHTQAPGESPRSSPLVSYSPSAGIYPEHIHVECAQSPYTRRNTPLTFRPPPLDVFPEGCYAELAQAPYPYEPQFDYALRGDTGGDGCLAAVNGPVMMVQPPQSAPTVEPAAQKSVAVTPRGVVSPAQGVLCTPGSARAGGTIQDMFSNRRASTPRSASKPAGTATSAESNLFDFAAAARSVLARTGLTSPRSAAQPTPRPLQLQQLRPGLSLSLLLDAEQGNPYRRNDDLSVTAEDAALAFDPSAYFSRGEEFAAEDEAGQPQQQQQSDARSAEESDGTTE